MGNVNSQGVISVSFLPVFGDSVDISEQIKDLLLHSESVKASIAFWTLSFNDLLSITNDLNVFRALRSTNSFICCDIQLPTNIDALATLKTAGVEVFLNFRRLVPALKKMTSSLGLLHTKMILADKDDGTADIWIGSHNWTQFALRGINTEISVILKVERFSNIYNEAYQFLRYVRSVCDQFDLSMADEYKKLQTKETIDIEPESVIIELEGRDVHKLAATSIWMFGTESSDYASLRRVGNSIKLIAYDVASGNKYLYRASIIQTGQMAAYNSFASGLQFTGVKRYAFSQHGVFPVLEPPGAIPTVVETQAIFFVAVQIDELVTDYFEVGSTSGNKTNLWEFADSDPILHLEKGMPWYREAGFERKASLENLIQVPYFKDTARSRERVEDAYLLLPVEEKRAIREYRFVSKGVVRLR